MREPELLSLLARLFADHQTRGEQGPLEVVPVVALDDLAETDEADLPTQDLLAAATRFAEGEFADAGLLAQEDAVPLVGDAALRAAVTASLVVDQSGVERALGFGADGDVTLGTTDLSVASEGERQLLGLARALLDERWAGRSLGVVSYTERGMARPLVRACWQTIAMAIGGAIPVGDLRTLIVVVRTPRLAYDIHCAAETGAHYVLQGKRLVRRSSPARARDIARSVVRNEGTHAVLFLGAGFSRSSSLPLGDGLRDQALRQRYPDGEPDVTGLAIRLYRDALRDGMLTDGEINRGEDAFVARLTLEQVVRIESTQWGGVPQTLVEFQQLHDSALAGPAPLRLIQALQGSRRFVIVTVNFDEVLDREAGDVITRFASDEEVAEFPAYVGRYLDGDETHIPLLKLHGTISEPMSCVVNEEQTERGLPEPKIAALEAVLGRDATRQIPLVYIGASLRDVDVVPALQSAAFAERTEEYWVGPLREPSIDAFAETRSEQWRSGLRDELEARFISTGADEFCALLAEEVDNL